MLMMRGVASTLEKHHRVQVLDEALEAAVQALAPLHPGAPAARQGGQPARHRLRARGHQPARASRRRSRTAGGRIEALRDRAGDHRPRGGGRHRRRRAARRRPRRSWRPRRRGSRELEERWKAEKELVDEILRSAQAARRASRSKDGSSSSRRRAQRRAPPGAERARCSASCTTAGRARRAAGRVAAHPARRVDEQAVASVVGDWTGIPVGRMVKNEIETVLKLAEHARPARHRPATTRSR